MQREFFCTLAVKAILEKLSCPQMNANIYSLCVCASEYNNQYYYF